MSILLLLRSGGTVGPPPPPPPPPTGVWTTLPTITGAAQLGRTLTCNPGVTSPVGTFSFQWLRAAYPGPGGTPSWQVIGGATSATYTLVGADVKQLMSCLVTVT